MLIFWRCELIVNASYTFGIHEQMSLSCDCSEIDDISISFDLPTRT